MGLVTIQRLFGGKGVYCRDVIVAIAYGGELRLKADLITAPAFEAAGATRWVYEGRRGAAALPYWSIPDDAYDDANLMAGWMRLALEAGLRAQASQAPSASKGGESIERRGLSTPSDHRTHPSSRISGPRRRTRS